MEKLWSDRAWDDYLYWQSLDRKTLKRVNALVKAIERNPMAPPAKAELLKDTDGLRSIRIDRANRLVYKVEDGRLLIVRCRGHYE